MRKLPTDKLFLFPFQIAWCAQILARPIGWPPTILLPNLVMYVTAAAAATAEIFE